MLLLTIYVYTVLFVRLCPPHILTLSRCGTRRVHTYLLYRVVAPYLSLKQQLLLHNACSLNPQWGSPTCFTKYHLLASVCPSLRQQVMGPDQRKADSLLTIIYSATPLIAFFLLDLHARLQVRSHTVVAPVRVVILSMQMASSTLPIARTLAGSTQCQAPASSIATSMANLQIALT
jgi:hypothetical protein